MISIVSVIVPYVCPVLNIWFAYPVLVLLLLISCMCSLYLVLNVLPVYPTYFSGQSMHFIWQMPLLLYLSICGCGLNIFCIVFRVRNATFIFISRKRFATFLTSLPLYVNGNKNCKQKNLNEYQ
jgi:hypothetical protein